MELPVTCILPTHNRRTFVVPAIKYFLRQDYQSKELIIIDEGATPIGDLTTIDNHIHYIRLDERIPLGAKRNLACRESRGEIIVHWDDDDWMAPWRLSYQVK